MLPELDTYSSRQLSFPTALPEKENLQSALSYDQSYADPVLKLCVEKLLPELQRSGQPFMKVSRKKHLFLENSIWVDRNGNIFEQYHSKNQIGYPNNDIKNKGLAGEGGCKTIWDLKPLHIKSDCPQMVRARFHLDRMTESLLKRLEAFIDDAKNENGLNSKYLLKPDMVITTNAKGEKVVYQMMPKGFADLSRISTKLSHLGRLRAMRDAGLGLIDMHNQGWAHLHVTTANIMVMNRKRDNPVTKLGDFDMSMKLGEGTGFSFRTDEYTDPKTLRFDCTGLESAKIHDQFAFGIVLCEILTGHLPRENYTAENLAVGMVDNLAEWMTEKDLQAISGFSLLNEAIQNVIRNCCIGPRKARPYRLPEFVKDIEKEIDELPISKKARSPQST